MEQVIRRALIVLTVLLILTGGWATLMGTLGAEGSEGYLHATVEKHAKDLWACQADPQRYFRKISCEDEFALKKDEFRSIQADIQKDYQTQGIGISLLLVALAVWPLFFVLRWISTGRWRKPEATE